MTLRRTDDQPFITREHIPAMAPDIVDPSSVFNPGAIRCGQDTILLLRVQTRGRRTYTVPARIGTDDSIRVAHRPCTFDWLGQQPAGEVFHIYDARMTSIEDEIHVVTAVDLADRCALAIWRAAGNETDFARLDRLEFCCWSAHRDSRNGVLFPEKIGGRFALLERPNGPVKGGPDSGNRVTLSLSDDLQSWEDRGTVLAGNFHFWDELIGSGPPPIKTHHGWLHLYHGIATHFQSSNIYQVGAVLLDLQDPTRVLARTRDNILEPREPWELTGQVPNVVFPGGMTVSKTDRTGAAPDEAILTVYYGAADTAVGRAEATVGQLVLDCRGGTP